MKTQNDKKLREMYLQMQVYHKQLRALQEQYENIEQKELEANSVASSLEEMKKVGPGESILVPINTGIFFKAKVEHTEDLLVNVGGGCVVKKTIGQTIDMMMGQLQEIRELKQRVERDIDTIALKASEIEQEFMRLKVE